MKVPAKRFAILLATLAAATCALAVLLAFMSAAAVRPARAAMPATAGDWFITANATGSNVYIGHTIDDRLDGPLFSGMFGSTGGGLFDVAVTPDGKTAVVGNFGDGAIYFLDVTHPDSPAFDLTRPISVALGFFVEDIAVTSDGKFALVVDGGFSPWIATISMLTHRLVFTQVMEDKSANAVEVSPDGTVVVADYFRGQLHTLRINSGGQLTYAHTYTYWRKVGVDHGLPVNVALAPDAQTLLVCDAFTSAVPVYQLTSPGVLAWRGFTKPLVNNPACACCTPGIESVAFSTDGSRAYAVINDRRDKDSNMLFNQIGVLDITAPGEVRVSHEGVPVTLPTSSGTQAFGVDVIAVAGRKAVVGQPTLSDIMTGTHILSIVDLNTYQVFTREIEGVATGVATIPLNQVHIPVIQRS